MHHMKEFYALPHEVIYIYIYIYMLRTPSVFFFLFPINDSACVKYHLLSFNSLDSQKKKKKKKKGFNSLQVVVTFFFQTSSSYS